MQCRNVTPAESIFDKTTITTKTLGMYGTMMNGFTRQNNLLKTLDLFNQMKNKDNLIVYCCVIKALSQIGDYSLSQSIIKEVSNDFLADIQIQTASVDMWVILKNVFRYIYLFTRKKFVLF